MRKALFLICSLTQSLAESIEPELAGGVCALEREREGRETDDEERKWKKMKQVRVERADSGDDPRFIGSRNCPTRFFDCFCRFSRRRVFLCFW